VRPQHAVGGDAARVGRVGRRGRVAGRKGRRHDHDFSRGTGSASRKERSHTSYVIRRLLQGIGALGRDREEEISRRKEEQACEVDRRRAQVGHLLSDERVNVNLHCLVHSKIF
jgi:hypothetical protein